MITLGLDTSGERLTVGVGRGKDLIGEVSLDTRTTYLTHLLPAIDFVLKNAGMAIRDVELFIVTLGPGAWTGIRIGVTTMKSFAHALEKPVVGLCALDVLAYNMRFTELPVYPIIDAARKQVYHAGFDCGSESPERISSYGLSKAEDFLRDLKTPAALIGNGVKKYGDKIDESEIVVVPGNLAHISAAGLLEAGIDRFEKEGPDDTHALAPLYLQKSDAERVWDEKINRNNSGGTPC